MTRVYVAGPMTGVPLYNWPAFEAAARRLRDRGHDVVTPTEIDEAEGWVVVDRWGGPSDYRDKILAVRTTEQFDYDKVLKRDLEAVESCDAIYLLKGWEDSPGALTELCHALDNCLQVRYEPGATSRLMVGDLPSRRDRLRADRVTDVETADNWPGVVYWPEGPRPRSFQETAALVEEASHRVRLPEADDGPTPWFRPLDEVLAQSRKWNDEHPVTDDVLTKFNETYGPVLQAMVDGDPEPDQTNPKDLLGLRKPPLRLVPPAFLVYVSKVMGLGAEKYGEYNWREKAVRRTVYLEAAMRHLLQALDGEDADPESGMPHEAHAAACMAIVLDSLAYGNLIDDRTTPGPAASLIRELTEADA